MHKEYLNEIWKDIKGYKGLYQVSNFGQIRSLDRYDSSNHKLKGKIMKLNNDGRGYLNINLYNNGKQKKFLVHRLVAEAFIPNPNNLPEVNHKDENKTNNRVDNLEWVDRKTNCNYGTRNKKISEKTIGTRYNRIDLSIPILQYSAEGQFIKEWPSAIEIKRQLKINDSYIALCCKGKFKTAKGYIWKYKH